MSSAEVILFVSSYSRACSATIDVVNTYKLPIKIVRLDSIKTRKAVSNGKIPITSVPTLLVAYEDQNFQLFVGHPKIRMWVEQLIQANREPEPQEEEEDDIIEEQLPEKSPEKPPVKNAPVTFDKVPLSSKDSEKKVGASMSEIVSIAKKMEAERDSVLKKDAT